MSIKNYQPRILHKLTIRMSVLMTLILFSGCFNSTDEPKPKPVALFTYVIGQQGEVTFINASINADTYFWEFGDFSTSSDTDPTNKYLKNGTFNVRLNATGPGGTASYNMSIVIDNILATRMYRNKTFTPITIVINGQTQTIPVGGEVTLSGKPDAAAVGSAYTSGATSSGTQVGLKISWTINDTFNDSFADLNVSGSFWFLKIINSSSRQVTKVFVNYGLQSQSIDNISIPNDGKTYNIGYYQSFSNSNVRLEATGAVWSFSPLYLGGLPNESGLIEATN
jgi:PKD domain